jgi:hypothetical protein
MNTWSAEFMFKMRIFLVAGITVLSLAPGLLAVDAQKPCTREEAIHAADDTDHLHNWNAVYRSFKRFSQCDDGGIAEGYSDDVGKLLADHWDQFSSLVKLATNDRAFKAFVVRHIDETIPADTLKKAVKNAKTRCPANATGLCKLIARAALN